MNDKTAYGRVFSNYKYQAKKRGLKFSLSKSDFYDLVQDRCWYCGKEPSNLLKQKDHGKYFYSCFYSGIDRVDNNTGYVKENCVTCCKTCNRMKQNMTVEDFISQVRNIAKHLEF